MTPGVTTGTAGPALWRHEARRCGPAALGLPVLTAVAVAATGIAAGPGVLTAAAAGYAVPLVVGLCVVTVVAGERMTELLLTVATEYRTTLRRRLTCVAAAAALAVAVVLVALGPALGDPAGTTARIAGFAVALGGVGIWSAARTRSAAAASGVVLAAWLGKILLVDQVLRPAVVQSAVLTLAGAAAAVTARRHLADVERVTREAS